MSEIKRVLLITNVPQTYRTPQFNEIALQLNEMNIELKVVFASAGYSRRKTQIDFSEMKFRYEILNSMKFNFGNVEKTMFTYGGLNSLIGRYKPDKIIVGGYSLATIKIFLRSLVSKISYIIWSESVKYPGRFDSMLRKFVRRLLISRASAFVVPGSWARNYLVSMGAADEKIFTSINTVDIGFFKNETNSLRPKATSAIRHLLYVGYLVPRKNVGNLISIIEELSKKRNDFVLDIVGDGSDRAKLEDMVRNKNLNDRVIFHGFRQKKDLPGYFATALVFLFQTDFDVWGLVLNESMAAGVAIMSSVNAGATHDLVVEEKTGYVIDYSNAAAVLEKINYLLDNPAIALETGRNAQVAIEQIASVKSSASGFIKSILYSE
jgi:glycosyltransferase involved in cell wall biosynthesis